MFCRECGSENSDQATHCFNCGTQLTAARTPYVAPVEISNNLVPAILATIFCCVPFGVVSIVYAAQVNGRAQAGDIAGAQLMASRSKMWFWISFGLGLGIFVLYFFLGFISAAFDL